MNSNSSCSFWKVFLIFLFLPSFHVIFRLVDQPFNFPFSFISPPHLYLSLHNLSFRLFVSIPRFHPASSPTLLRCLPSLAHLFFFTPPPSCFLNSFPAHLYSRSHLVNFTLFCAVSFHLSLIFFSSLLALSLDIQNMSKRFERMCPT